MDEAFKKLIDAGYQVRPASIQDLPQAVPMFNAAEAELSGAGAWTVERYEKEWQQTGLDLATSTRLVFDPGGQVVGCVELWDNFDPPARPWIWGRVHPQWKGQGIGSAMLAWAFNTSYRAIQRLPDDARLAAQVAAPSHHQPSLALFENSGMSLCRYTWRMLIELETPILQPVWPQGIQIRTLRYPQDLEAIYRLQDEAFQEHWGYIQRPFEEGFQRWKSYVFDAQKLKPELWFVALEGERLVGFINSQEQHDVISDMGYIPTLAVLKPFRQRGLGQALLQQAFQALQERGVKRVGLYVDAKNKTGATRLYQRVGMHVEQEIVHYEIELRPGRELAIAE